MRTYGYCYACRKFKQVLVAAHHLAVGRLEGVCQECEEQGRS